MENPNKLSSQQRNSIDLLIFCCDPGFYCKGLTPTKNFGVGLYSMTFSHKKRSQK